jgi:Transposase
VLFIGDDWAEAHHDIEVQDETGRRLARRRLPEGVAGMAALHALVADHLGDGEPADVVVGIETDRGPWVQALLAAGYRVYAVNPLSAARYRDRHVVSDTHRARGATHHQALRALANRLVGILHGCLRHRTTYHEATAWPAGAQQELATAA